MTTSNLPWFIDWTSRFLCNIALYSIGPCFHHQSHPQLGVVTVHESRQIGSGQTGDDKSEHWHSGNQQTKMGEFNSYDHCIYYCRQESLRRNGVAIMVNKRVWNAVLGCSLKNDRMISVHLQGKPFNITVTQVYAPTSNAEEAEVEQFYEDLQDLLELTPKKRCPFHYRGLECKSRKSRNPWSNR